jgi:hypothetical protein
VLQEIIFGWYHGLAYASEPQVIHELRFQWELLKQWYEWQKFKFWLRMLFLVLEFQRKIEEYEKKKEGLTIAKKRKSPKNVRNGGRAEEKRKKGLNNITLKEV